MEDIVNYIVNFLNQKNLKAKDIIIITISSSFIFWLISSLLNKIMLFIIKLSRLNLKKINDMHRKYIKRKLKGKEYFNIVKRLENGEKLKWYEKKSYYTNKELLSKQQNNLLLNKGK